MDTDKYREMLTNNKCINKCVTEEVLVDPNSIVLINDKHELLNAEIEQDILSQTPDHTEEQDNIKYFLMKIALLKQDKQDCIEHLKIRVDIVKIADLTKRMYAILKLIKVYRKLFKYRQQLREFISLKFGYEVKTIIDDFGQTHISEAEIDNVEAFYLKFNHLITKMNNMEEFNIFIEEDPLRMTFPIDNIRRIPIFKF